jgi:hypothetical protein
MATIRASIAPQANEVTEATRRSIFDAIQMGDAKWYGRLDDIDFLIRIFDLSALPSTDSRHANMAGDISRHRLMNEDWAEDWVFSDRRLNLRHGPDEVFLRFLCEMVHPVVRTGEDEIDGLVANFNRYLTKDGFQIFPVDYVSGRRIFAASRALPGVQSAIVGARAIADELSSEHVTAQITRMQTNIDADPALAIGSAKEFVESLCKAILAARRVKVSGREDFAQLSNMTREALGLKVNPKADVTLKSLPAPWPR